MSESNNRPITGRQIAAARVTGHHTAGNPSRRWHYRGRRRSHQSAKTADHGESQALDDRKELSAGGIEFINGDGRELKRRGARGRGQTRRDGCAGILWRAGGRRDWLAGGFSEAQYEV